MMRFEDLMKNIDRDRNNENDDDEEEEVSPLAPLPDSIENGDIAQTNSFFSSNHQQPSSNSFFSSTRPQHEHFGSSVQHQTIDIQHHTHFAASVDNQQHNHFASKPVSTTSIPILMFDNQNNQNQISRQPPQSSNNYFSSKSDNHQLNPSIFNNASSSSAVTIKKKEDNSNCFIPYKYSIVDSKTMKVYYRSDTGISRSMIEYEINSWVYLNIPVENQNDIDKMLFHIKEHTCSESITFDTNLQCFILKPAEFITEKIKNLCSFYPVVPPVTTYSILNHLKEKFFQATDKQGKSTSLSNKQLPSKIEEHPFYKFYSDSAMINFSCFKTFIFLNSPVEDILIFIEYDSSYLDSKTHTPNIEVNLWYYDNNNLNDIIQNQIKNQIKNKLSLNKVFTMSFSNINDMKKEFLEKVEKKADLFVHYSETVKEEEKENRINEEILDSVKRIEKIEMIDLYNFASKVYSHLPSLSIKNIINNLNLSMEEDKETNPLDRNYILFSNDEEIINKSVECLKKVDEENYINGCKKFFKSMKYKSSDSSEDCSLNENLNFFCCNMVSECLVISRLYMMLSSRIFEISQASCCNISKVCSNLDEDENYVTKGFIFGYDPILACVSEISDFDKIPSNSLKIGIYGNVYITPLSYILLDNMKKCRNVNQGMVDDLYSFIDQTWLIKKIYCLKGLETPVIEDLNSSFGIYKGNVFSTESLEDYSYIYTWDVIFSFNNYSWIGVKTEENGSLCFSYFGIEYEVEHIFPAMRNAIEMYLKIFLKTNAIPSVDEIANNVDLCTRNMQIKKKITAYNVEKYESILERKTIEEIKEKIIKRKIVYVWFRESEQELTTNEHISTQYTIVYRKFIKNVLEVNLYNFLYCYYNKVETKPVSVPTAVVPTASIVVQQIEPKNEENYIKIKKKML